MANSTPTNDHHSDHVDATPKIHPVDAMINEGAPVTAAPVAGAIADTITAGAEAAADHVKGASQTVADEADAVKSRFAKAIDDARAAASDLTAAAGDKAMATASDLNDQATALANQARDKSLEIANQGKVKTSEAIAVVARSLNDTATVIDEKLGVQYGNYARSAAQTLESSADHIANNDIVDLSAELTENVKEFVRKSPATAIGIAAVTGYLFARLFSRSSRDDA